MTNDEALDKILDAKNNVEITEMVNEIYSTFKGREGSLMKRYELHIDVLNVKLDHYEFLSKWLYDEGKII